MTTSKAILGTVETCNIKLGAYRWVTAPYDTYIDETVIMDLENLPSPLLDLGVCRQDVSLSMTVQTFLHKTGVPLTLKQKLIIARDLSISFTLEEFSGANLARALYNTNYAIKKFAASPAVVQAAAVPVGNILQMTSSTNWVVGQYVALGTSPSALVNSSDEFRIIEISGNFLIFDRVITTVYGAAPYVGMILSYKVPFGTAKACKMALFGVIDDTEEGQLVIAVPRAVVTSGLSGGIPAGSNIELPITVSAEAFLDIDIADNSLANVIRFQ